MGDALKAHETPIIESLAAFAEMERIRLSQHESLIQQAALLKAGSATAAFAEDVRRYIGIGLDRFGSTELSAWREQERYYADRMRRIDADAWLATQRSYRELSSSSVKEAMMLAEQAQALRITSESAAYLTSVGSLADKMLGLPTLDVLKSPTHLQAFAQTSSIADFIAASSRVDQRLRDATRLFAEQAIPTFTGLHAYGRFMDAAGLALPHWPNQRLLRSRKKSRRFRERLNENAEPRPARKGKSLIHRYELTLRDILNEAMSATYGNDWPLVRLPACGCKDLLGKWQKRGGNVLDHADYAHYERIMSDPQHFEAIFCVGFDDPEALQLPIKKAGELRAALLHCHEFSKDHLRDLRLTWKTIETGLLAMSDDCEEGW